MNYVLLIVAILSAGVGAISAFIAWGLLGLSAPAFSNGLVFYGLFFGIPVGAVAVLVAWCFMMFSGKQGWASLIGILPTLVVLCTIAFEACRRS